MKDFKSGEISPNLVTLLDSSIGLVSERLDTQKQVLH